MQLSEPPSEYQSSWQGYQRYRPLAGLRWLPSQHLTTRRGSRSAHHILRLRVKGMQLSEGRVAITVLETFPEGVSVGREQVLLSPLLHIINDCASSPTQKVSGVMTRPLCELAHAESIRGYDPTSSTLMDIFQTFDEYGESRWLDGSSRPPAFPGLPAIKSKPVISYTCRRLCWATCVACCSEDHPFLTL